LAFAEQRQESFHSAKSKYIGSRLQALHLESTILQMLSKHLLVGVGGAVRVGDHLLNQVVGEDVKPTHLLDQESTIRLLRLAECCTSTVYLPARIHLLYKQLPLFRRYLTRQ
jgi:hypothetical protein